MPLSIADPYKSAAYEPENTASHIIYRVGRLLRFRAAEHFRAKNIPLSPEQWEILIKTVTAGPQPINSLVDKTLRDHPNITRLVDGLESAGLVRRSPNPDDRRSHLVEITAAGKELADNTLPGVIEAKSVFYDGLNEREMHHLITLLQVVESNLSR